MPLNVGLGSVVSVPMFRFAGERIAPMSDVYFLDDSDEIIFQRQLSLIELVTVAQGLTGAASSLMQSAREGLSAVAGWAASKSAITETIAKLKDSTRVLEEEAAKFTF